MLFTDAGLSPAQISSLFVIWSVTAFALEIPSGVWADVFSPEGHRPRGRRQHDGHAGRRRARRSRAGRRRLPGRRRRQRGRLPGRRHPGPDPAGIPRPARGAGDLRRRPALRPGRGARLARPAAQPAPAGGHHGRSLPRRISSAARRRHRRRRGHGALAHADAVRRLRRGRLAGRGVRWTAPGLAAAAVLLAAGAAWRTPLGFVLAAAYGIVEWAIAAMEAALQDGLADRSRATVTSMSGLGAEVFAVLAFAGYALGSVWAAPWLLFTLAAVPYLLLAVAVRRGPRGPSPDPE
ncbi:hypothetical protein [Acrocarpospora corrugata]|uniref:hypothetical protein n=1 Tax=Acrocarpospora corrugata TaxID=35763 RepID=UPI001FE4B53A|nr:hypothetical protein [Acrocarpospora corrugata]